MYIKTNKGSNDLTIRENYLHQSSDLSTNSKKNWFMTMAIIFGVILLLLLCFLIYKGRTAT